MVARALSNLMEANPNTTSLIAGSGAVSLLTAKLLNIEFIDLAEQCIQCLYQISQHYPQQLLKEGTMGTSLMYFDFFPLNIQRSLFKMSYNVCKRIPNDSFDLIYPIIPTLTIHVLNQDSQISEFSCKTFTAIFRNFPKEEVVLKICSEGILDNIFKILEKRDNHVVYNSSINLLYSICQSSIELTKKLLKMKIGNLISNILLQDQDTKDKPIPIVELLQIIIELVPRIKYSEQLVTEMNQTRRKELFHSITSPIKENYKSGFLTREELIKEDSFIEFGKLMIPILMKVYSTNMNPNVRSFCLTIIGSILYYSTNEILKDILLDIPISSFIAKLLSSNDLIFVSTGIQIATILIQKLPEIFNIYFVREGVVGEIKKLSGISSKNEELLFDLMKNKSKLAFEIAEKEFKQKFDEINKINKEGEKLEIPKFIKPFIEPPNLPETSKLFERDSFKSSELAEYVVSSCQIFHKTYFLDSSPKNSIICEKMKNLCEDLIELMDEDDKEEEKEILTKISKILFDEEGISTFEFINSGIIKTLLKYLQKDRMNLFLEIFNKEIEKEKEFSPFKYGSFGTPSSPFQSSPLKNRLLKSYTFLNELILKIQNSLSSEENLPLIVNDTSSITGSIQNIFENLSRDITIQLLKIGQEESKEIIINPLIEIKNLQDYIDGDSEYDISQLFNGFSLEDFHEEDHKIKVNEFKIDRKLPKEFFKNEMKRSNEIEMKYNFYLNGKKLSPNSNLIHSIYHYKDWSKENLKSKHPMFMKQLWENKTIIYYKEFEKEDEKNDFEMNEFVRESLDLLKLLELHSNEKRIFQNEKLTAKLQRQLSDPFILLTKCLPNWCYYLTNHYPFLFPFETRKYFFESTSLGIARSIKTLQDKLTQKDKILKILSMEKDKVLISRDYLLPFTHHILSCNFNGLLEIQYEDEIGFGNGPTMEYYSLVSKEFQLSELNLWMNENKQSKYIEHKFGLYPIPIDENHVYYENMFYLLGQFVSRGIYDGRLMDLTFTNSFLKLLKGIDLNFEDLKEIDNGIYKFLKELKQESNIKKIEDLAISYEVPKYPNIKLKKHKNEDVNINNKNDYIDEVLQLLLKDGVQLQVNSFKRGYNSLLNLNNLFIFNYKELDLLFNGEKQIWDEKILVSSIKCDFGYSISSNIIQNFIKILVEMDPHYQRLFLQFVTGSPKLPVGGISNLKPKLTIVRKVVEKNQKPDDVLPSVMTCTNYLKLPEYSNIQILKQQLYKAIEEGQGAFLLS